MKPTIDRVSVKNSVTFDFYRFGTEYICTLTFPFGGSIREAFESVMSLLHTWPTTDGVVVRQFVRGHYARSLSCSDIFNTVLRNRNMPF